MQSKHPRMKLSREEETFLLHWIYDEQHYQEGTGPAKLLQVKHGAVPADLAIIVAAAIPDTADQEAAGSDPPPSESPRWPWSDESFNLRLAEAREILAKRQSGHARDESSLAK